MKKTLHIELTKSDYEKFRYFLKTEKINYEPSACFNLIHIVVNVDEIELKKCEEFLDTLDNEEDEDFDDRYYSNDYKDMFDEY